MAANASTRRLAISLAFDRSNALLGEIFACGRDVRRKLRHLAHSAGMIDSWATARVENSRD
jgi:hypothetical protein